DQRLVLDEEYLLSVAGRQRDEIVVLRRNTCRSIAALGLERNRQRAGQACRMPIENNIAADLLLDRCVHDLGAETLRSWRLHRRPAALAPQQRQHPALDLPIDTQLAGVDR